MMTAVRRRYMSFLRYMKRTYKRQNNSKQSRIKKLKTPQLWTVRPVSKPYAPKKLAKEDETTDSSA